ncbi:MAG: ATP-binding cassette domain-containing protein [Verrucomicrobia bacterium]|nr:ATP-binding cassette domain-containing protein [Verrucomicrobiota bacterium]
MDDGKRDSLLAMITSSSNVDFVPKGMALASAGEITAVIGPNFSGRSRFMKSMAGLEHHHGDGRTIRDELAVYIRPDVDLSISGLRPSVRDEVSYHLGGNPHRESIFKLLRSAGLENRLDQNPTTLSGGEQAALVLIIKLALNPGLLAVDCALEQLHPELKDRLLTEVKRCDLIRTTFLLADNRLPESRVPIETALELPDSTITNPENQHDRSPPFGHLDSSVVLPLRTEPTAIELDDLSFSYARSKPVLKNLNLQLTPGKIHMIRGRNGAGKSTLAKLLCGVLRCKSGAIKSNDRKLVPYSAPGRLVAYHFQFPDSQFVARTVGEDVASGPAARGLLGVALSSRVDAVLAAFGLETLKESEIFELPYVIRKRVAIAAIVATGAKWMIFDEPTLGQDEGSCSFLAAVFSQLTSLGVGVIVISHSRLFADSLNGERHYLEDGAFKEPWSEGRL